MTKRCDCGKFISYTKKQCSECYDLPPKMKANVRKINTITPKEKAAIKELDKIVDKKNNLWPKGGTHPSVSICDNVKETYRHYDKSDKVDESFKLPTDNEIEMGDIIEAASGYNLSFKAIDRIVKALVKARFHR
jgi:hypothetical protein